MLSFEVVRSPAKVCWWVKVNGSLLQTFDTKAQALACAEQLRRKY